MFASSLGETSIYKELVIHTLAALKAMGSTSKFIHDTSCYEYNLSN